jgi:hypothetical protein
MTIFGVHLSILAGIGVPLPLPEMALSAIDSVEIAAVTRDPSALQIQFKAGRGAALADVIDYPLMNIPGLMAGSRIVVMLTLGILPNVLFDGLITQVQLNPGQGQGDGTLAVTALDIRQAMGRDEVSTEYPGIPVAAIVPIVLAKYARYGVIPMIIPPIPTDIPLPIDRIITQHETDLAFLNRLASENGCVFTMTPGPLPMTNTAYFGPQPRLGLPQSALTLNMGPDSNLLSINFQNNASDAHRVSGAVQDRTTGVSVPVETVPPLTVPLATEPAILNPEVAGVRSYRPDGARTAAAALAEAQAASEASAQVLTAEGELDGNRYGKVLQPRQLVGLRGAGRAHNGFYFVEEVKHVIKRGEYKQQFKLSREGTGTTTPVVMP